MRPKVDSLFVNKDRRKKKKKKEVRAIGIWMVMRLTLREEYTNQ